MNTTNIASSSPFCLGLLFFSSHDISQWRRSPGIMDTNRPVEQRHFPRAHDELQPQIGVMLSHIAMTNMFNVSWPYLDVIGFFVDGELDTFC
jgi:hypothetical protein